MIPSDIIRYKRKYNCTTAEAIADRDYPINRNDILMLFYECEKRMPTAQEIETMHPQTDAYIAEYADEMQREYNSHYG
jgi:hypothetical protein